MATAESFSFSRNEGKTPGVEIIYLTGPLTLRNLFAFQDDLRGSPPCANTIFDLSAVPYLDSCGMGALINHYVHCQKCGCKLIVAGVNRRVLELFRMTKVDTIIPMAASVAEAESQLA
jgi:anti-sigma B factor antagonist